MDNEKFFTVGELARRCGVTVRTLQFYDKDGLLSPSHYTEGGRRLYERRDIIRLQQILFFKSFGFSLGEIRDKLRLIESADEMSSLLIKQRNVLVEQISKIQDIVDFLDKVIIETQQGKHLGTDKIVMVMEMMRKGNPYAFVIRYFDQDQIETLFKLQDEKNLDNGMPTEWEAMFKEVISLHQNGVDPEGSEGQELAARWWSMVQKYTGGDAGLIKTLMSIGADVENWPQEVDEFKTAVRSFWKRHLQNIFKLDKSCTSRTLQMRQ